MKKFPFFFIFLMIISGLGCSKKTVITAEDLDASIKKTTQNTLFTGLAVSVVKKDKILFQKAYGQANVAKNAPYTNQTLQPIASVSKTFIGVALMKAIEQGYFTLETPINDILPFTVKNPNFPDKPITIKHLATHTSGLIDVEKTYFKSHSILSGENATTEEAKRMINELGFAQNSTILPLKDFLKAYYTEGGSLYSTSNFQNTEPGVAYSYSNIAASLAAYLIEVKAGKSFVDYCKDNIFTPLSMTNTNWSISASNRAQLATLYWNKSTPLPYYGSASYPDGELVTSNEDLTKYLMEMIKGFAGESTFLKKESFDMLFKKQFNIEKMPLNMNPKEDNMGIFWVYFKNGRLGHTGGDLGVTTFMAFYPETKTGFIFLSNSEVENLDDSVPIQKQLQSILSAMKEFESKN